MLGVLVAWFAWAVIIPWSLAAPPTALFTVIYVVVLAGHGAALFWVLGSSVTPGLTGRARWFRCAQLVATTLVLWAPAHRWADDGGQPWAWSAGFTIAACALLGRRTAGLAGAVVTAAAVAGGAVFGGSAVASVCIALVTAAIVWVMCQALVWMLRLVWAARAGREAQAELVIAQERLRVSRELHDVLGHRLSVIALKAELAAGYADHDPGRVAAENEEIRRIARETLQDARRAVHDRMRADLPSQIRTAELVLGAAGITVAVDVPEDVLDRASPTCSELLATVTREAVTNILSHSHASCVAISLGTAQDQVRLTVTNDGVPGAGRGASSDGSGLAGLAARCAAHGATLTIARHESSFELSVRCPADPAGRR